MINYLKPISRLGRRIPISPILAFLVTVYLPIFYYQNNSEVLEIDSLWHTITLCLGFGLSVLILFTAFFRGNIQRSGIATSVFMAIFYSYQFLHNLFSKVDLITLEPYTLIPLILFLGIYIGITSSSTYGSIFWKVCTFVLAVLNLVNITTLAIAELKTDLIHQESVSMEEDNPTSQTIHQDNETRQYPDIYYLVFDEFAGFDVMESYWKYDQIHEFTDFLVDEGFYVATSSRSQTYRTLVEMASRLNFRVFDNDQDAKVYFKAIANNQVMQNLKAMGYSTITFDGTGGPFAYPGRPPIVADYHFETDAASIHRGILDLDEFDKLVLRETPFQNNLEMRSRIDPIIRIIRDNILFSFKRLEDLDDIQSPKFTYAHIMIVHEPFLFTKDGDWTRPKEFHNWNSYLGSYIYTLDQIKNLISRILANYDQNNMPVIILQSDHGARNLPSKTENNILLSDYDEDYKYHIMNALLLPGANYEELTPTWNPVNTFPIVFNQYFDMNIPLVK